MGNVKTITSELTDEFDELVQEGIGSIISDIPDYKKAYNLLSRALTLRYDEEIDEIAKECQTKMDLRLKVNNLLRECSRLNKEGNHQEALQYYLKAVSLDPSIEISKQYSFFIREYSVAEDVSEKHIEEAQNLMEQAIQLYEQKDYDKALSYFIKAYKINPCFRYIDRITRLLIQMKQYNRAYQFIESLMDNNSSLLETVEINIEILSKKLSRIANFLKDKEFVKKHLQELITEKTQLEEQAPKDPLKSISKYSQYLSAYHQVKQHIDRSQRRLYTIEKELEKHFSRVFEPY